MNTLCQWAGPLIRVIGMGIGVAPAKEHLEDRDVIIGAARHLDTVPYPSTLKIALPSPLSSLGELLHEHQHKKIAILASGDPLLFGIGDWLERQSSIGSIARKGLMLPKRISMVSYNLWNLERWPVHAVYEL